MKKRRLIIISKNVNREPRKAPLVYINRVKMTELDDKCEYKFVPVGKDADDNVVDASELDQIEKIKYDKCVDRKIKRDKRDHMILTAESELIRIIKHLSKRNEMVKKRDYIPDVLSLKVGRSYTAYKDRMTKSGMIVTYNGIKYKRIVVSSSHSRTQKAMFVAEDIWDKAWKILLCGLKNDMEYKYMSKWNSYIGLAATDSIPVSMPNIVVINDMKIIQEETFDTVNECVTTDEDGNLHREFSVDNNRKEKLEVNAFDGAGLVTVKKAKQWSKELNLDYTPASFQFRCIPCLKGKLYTMPLTEFSEKIGSSKIIDIKGKEWDLFNDRIDCILTKSQFKFHDLYASIEDWKRNFDEVLYDYSRTFNISSYDEKMSDLRKTTVMAYQPLQTLEFEENEVEKLCEPTVASYKEACSSVKGFLKYRGIMSEQDKYDDVDWSKYPSYYQAMAYKPELYNDTFIQKKVKQDLKSGKERAYVGKVRVNGNYQTFTPDLYALMQHAFRVKVTGLLNKNQVYSNFWNHNLQADNRCIDIIRSPHIANEHCLAEVATNEEMERWFMYQKTGIIASVFNNTIAQKLNSADFDGDHVLTTDNAIICAAAKRKPANTIRHVKVDNRKDCEKQEKTINVNNMKAIIDCDYKGYKNNIGNVINPISVLWSLPQSEDIQDYIKIMSIVGSITIDYAKHGEESEIPANIKNILSEHNKPYFMRYLRSMRKKRSMEKEFNTNAGLVGRESKLLFDNTACTMNKICHYMETEISKVTCSIEENSIFDYTKLIAREQNIKSPKYTQVKNCLCELQEEFGDISNSNYYSEDFCASGDIEKDRRYTALYDKALADLLEIEGDISDLLDMVLLIYYTDKGFMKKFQDKSILWGCFGEQLIERCKGNFVSSLTDEEIKKIAGRREKAEKSIAALQKSREKNYTITEFEKEKVKENKVDFSSEDISWIKAITRVKKGDKKENLVECRKLLLALIYICRKCNTRRIQLIQSQNNRINRTSLCKLVKINRKHLDDILKILRSKDVIDYTVDNKNHLVIEVKMVPGAGERILHKNVQYTKLYAVANEHFREKVQKNVKKSCS